MVRQDEPTMGQGGLCGVTTPGIDSLPPMSSPPTAGANANGIASEVQESLTSLLGTEGTVCQDDLVAKLRSVISENLELKETVAQNNLALRQQLALVVRWNQQNEQQQQQQRQRLLEFNQQLSTLQQENATLKAYLAGSKTPDVPQPRFQELDETVRLLNTRLEVAERNLRQVQEEREKLNAQKSRLEGDITLLKCDLTTARSEQERLQLERFELLSTASDLRQQLRKAREGAAAQARSLEASPVYEGMGGALGEAEFKKMKDQLKREQDTSATLLQELHDTRTQVENLESEVHRAQEETSLYKERCKNLQSKVDVAFAHAPITDTSRREPFDGLERKRLMDEAAMLREEVDTLDAALTAERQKTADERAGLAKSHAELGRMKKELQEAKERLERETQNDQYYQAKIKSANEKYDEATAKLMSYEELLAAKNDELSRLKKDLGQAKASLTERASEGETIAILRAQVEVYQGDFRAEREAREALATDREKLRDELRHLQTRNTQLVDELEAYQRRHLNQGQGRGSRAPSEEPAGGMAAGGGAAAGPPASAMLSPEVLWDKLSNTSDKKEEDKREEEIDENLFYCPKCNKSFAQYRPLEEHVNRCLDED